MLKQLNTCALVYRCFTSQNVYYRRDEAGIPASVMCNAQCVGCISDQPDDGPPASHERMDDGPAAEEMAAIGVDHLLNATGRVMVSFGQGCEGEPLTRWKPIAEAIRLMRAKTRRGSININTNGSLTQRGFTGRQNRQIADSGTESDGQEVSRQSGPPAGQKAASIRFS